MGGDKDPAVAWQPLATEAACAWDKSHPCCQRVSSPARPEMQICRSKRARAEACVTSRAAGVAPLGGRQERPQSPLHRQAGQGRRQWFGRGRRRAEPGTGDVDSEEVTVWGSVFSTVVCRLRARMAHQQEAPCSSQPAGCLSVGPRKPTAKPVPSAVPCSVGTPGSRSSAGRTCR